MQVRELRPVHPWGDGPGRMLHRPPLRGRPSAQKLLCLACPCSIWLKTVRCAVIASLRCRGVASSPWKHTKWPVPG